MEDIVPEQELADCTIHQTQSFRKPGSKGFFGSPATISQTIKFLNLPQLYQFCSVCNERMGKLAAESCVKCQAISHIKCSPSVLDLNSNKIVQRCRFCINEERCLICKKEIFHSSNNIICSICHNQMHPQCYELPLALFDSSNILFSQIYGKNTGLNRTVCQECFLFWKKDQLCQVVVRGNNRYGFYKVNHFSPIHYTWRAVTNKQNMDVQDQYSQEETFSQQIQNIMSIDCINTSKSQRVTLQQLYLHICKQNFKQGKIKSPYKFLVKWKNDARLVWEQEEVVRPYKQLLKNFINHLLYNLLSIDQPLIKQNLVFSQRINVLIERQKIMSSIKFIGRQNSKFASNNQKIQHKVYQLFKKNEKQCIKAKKTEDPLRMDIICRLINEVYFKLKKNAPVFVFTENHRLEWWINSLNLNCPYHSILRIYGSETYISELLDNHFYLRKGQQHNTNKFNVYLFDSDTIHLVISRIPLFDLINRSSSLLIIDNCLNNTINHYYQKVTVPRIKLITKKVIENTQSYLKVTRTQSRPSFSTNQIPPTLEKYQISNVYDDEVIEMSSKKMNQIWSQTITIFALQEHEKCLIFDTIQRVVFIRYVMSFGLTAESWTQISMNIVKIQRNFFSNWGTFESIKFLKKYMTHFLSALNYLSQNPKEENNIIKQFFFFHLEPAQIIRRINMLNRVKLFYREYSSQNSRIQSQNSPQLKEDESSKTCADSNDINICEALLDRGFGRWQAISDYSRIWQPKLPRQSLREYLCCKAQIDMVSMATFTKIIEKQIMKIIEGLAVNTT